MSEALIYSPPAEEPEPQAKYDPADEAPPPEEDWQEATLKRLEAWIEERERLIAEFESRFADPVGIA